MRSGGSASPMGVDPLDMLRDRGGRITASELQRFIPASCLALSFLTFAAIFLFGNREIYSAVLSQLGLTPYTFPFLDAYGVLSTGECHRYGIDVIAENPCDILGRRLDYSPFWLITAKLGLNTGFTPILGLTLDLLFLIWVFFLPPARGWKAVLVFTLAVLSSMVAFALERGNLDLAIFVVAVVAAHWALRSKLWRIATFALIALAALIKYYPGVMLILAIRERLAAFGLLVFAAIGVTGLFVAYEGTDLLRTLAQIENGYWFTIAFGAENLPRGLVTLLPGLFPDPAWAVAVELGFAILAGFGAIMIAVSENLHEGLDLLPERIRNLLLIGCALIVGCFFAAQNGPYRGIYFLLVLPGLTALWQAPIAAPARQRFGLTSGCILFLMWNDTLYRAMMDCFGAFATTPEESAAAQFIFWLVREIAWWWVVTVLLALLLCLIAQSETGRQLLRILPHRPAPLAAAAAGERKPRAEGARDDPRRPS